MIILMNEDIFLEDAQPPMPISPLCLWLFCIGGGRQRTGCDGARCIQCLCHLICRGTITGGTANKSWTSEASGAPQRFLWKQSCSLESVCCQPCPGSPAYKKALMQVLQRQIGIPLSVEWPAEVIGICYIYRLCNLICGILDRSAHAILSHWGQRLPSSAPYPSLPVCYLCGHSEQQRWASHKLELTTYLFFF